MEKTKLRILKVREKSVILLAKYHTSLNNKLIRANCYRLMLFKYFIDLCGNYIYLLVCIYLQYY